MVASAHVAAVVHGNIVKEQPVVGSALPVLLVVSHV